MTILIKLGGSLITDKRKVRSFRAGVARALAEQLSRLHEGNEKRRLIIGHGSGSFGHVEAQKHGTAQGVSTPQDRLGFARVGAIATELSLLLQNEFIAAGLPVMRFQPSSTTIANCGQIVSYDTRALSLALDKGLIPLLHGDVALDEAINGTIVSTESLFAYVAAPLKVSRIILLGEVDGVLDRRGAVIPLITPQSLGGALSALRGARGVDVTGGMRQKVKTMTALARAQPTLHVVIANGRREDILVDLLERQLQIGTRISSDCSPNPPQF